MNYMFKNDWEIILISFLNETNILNIIKKEYQTKKIYPKYEQIFRALELCSYSDTKVVILGQDPYHGDMEANGLAFSVNENVKITPSLRNIFKELESDLNVKRNNTNLENWAKQGILLLNTILTVEKDKPLSHSNIGWEKITRYIIEKLNEKNDSIIFVLWGKNAQIYKPLITNKKHYIIEASHPSPLSAYRGFFGSRPFSTINNILKHNNIKQIEWSD